MHACCQFNDAEAGALYRVHAVPLMQHRDEIILGIPMGPVGPMGFPWEWELLG